MQKGTNPKDNWRNRPRVNQRIRVREVRVIGPDGKMIGVMNTEDAIQKAFDIDLDLVEIAPTEKPPVCKIMDYGKYLYELKKKDKEAKKHQVGMHLKEVRFTSRIGEHDYGVKLRHIRDFLEHGNRVKVVLRFRGREITHKEVGQKVIERVAEDIADIGKVETGPKFEGRFIILQIVPLGKRKDKKPEKRKGE